MVVDPRAAEAARVAGMTGEVSQAPLRPPATARREEVTTRGTVGSGVDRLRLVRSLKLARLRH